MELQKNTKIRVMIVDDSIIYRAVIQDIIKSDKENRFEVVASAQNGMAALEKLKQHEIDVITMDVEMPKLNGLETLKIIMETCPKPVLMLSSKTNPEAKETIEALSLGAYDFLQKTPKQLDMSLLREEILDKLYQASQMKSFGKKTKEIKKIIVLDKKEQQVKTEGLDHLVVLGCSTGGPRALKTIFELLPTDLNMGMVVVQHMPEGPYTASLARHLNSFTHYEVVEASDGEEVKNGKIIIARGGFHTEIYKRGSKYQTVLNKREPVSGHRPSVDVLFSSVSRIKHDIQVTGVILTGMGDDGTRGAIELHSKGVPIIAESEETAIIFGMPMQAIKKGVVEYIEPLQDVIKRIGLITKK